MQLTDLQQLNEMGKAKVCPTCGHTMAGFHYWYQGGWKCKSSSLANPGAGVAGGVAPASAPALASKPTPAPAQAVAPAVQPSATPAPAPAPAPAARPATPAKPAAAVGNEGKVAKWMSSHGVTKFTQAADGTYDVDGDVHLDDFNNVKLPVAFGTVVGDFSCYGNALASMEGMPKVVTGSFNVHHTDIDTFVGSPETVGDAQDQYGSAHCDVSSNKKITSVDGLPKQIYGSLIAKDLKGLKTLQGIHKAVKTINGRADFAGTPLESHVLGLLLIRGLEEVNLDVAKVAQIINKHLANDRDVNMCQEELIDGGFAKFAKL